MISHKAIAEILDLPERVISDPDDMAASLTLTTFPHNKNEVSDEVHSFYHQLKKNLEELGVEFIPYENALFTVSWGSIFKRLAKLVVNDLIYIFHKLTNQETRRVWMGQSAFKNATNRQRIKPGISVIALGEYETGKMPMDYTASFRRTSVITITDMPEHISRDTSFGEHFETALDLFSYHMTNIVIGVTNDHWLLYNFNASHPIFSRNEEFKKNLLQAFVPKIFAPINPPHLDNFTVEEEAFSATDAEHKPYVDDMVDGGKLLGETNLYPSGKRLREMSFRNSFYKWVGKLHIDKRNGMSFGFLARQMPVELNSVQTKNEIRHGLSIGPKEWNRGYWYHEGKLYVRVSLPDSEDVALPVPDVWVLTQRSGSDKTNMRPVKDLVKIGLQSGGMYLQTPNGVTIEEDYRPSFDTKVILGHAVGNAIAASVFKHLRAQEEFVKQITNEGIGIAHWHGYIHPEKTPSGYRDHGQHRPHVACSSPQSALFALSGKFNEIRSALQNNQQYSGDIHVEPHHGVNVNFPSLQKLGRYLRDNPQASELGNEYLQAYFENN